MLDLSVIVVLILVAFYLAGLLSAGHAVQEGHAAEGTVAWVLGLIFIPMLAVPFYWTFALHHRKELFSGRLKWSIGASDAPQVDEDGDGCQTCLTEFDSLERLSPFRWRYGTWVRVLVNAEATYDAVFEAIDDAEHEVLAHYYTIRDDATGRAFFDRLRDAAQRGVRVRLLYDSFGSSSLHSRSNREELRRHGVEAHAFNMRFCGALTRWHVNFRNHRKICVVDAATGFTGGINIGDEYRGWDPRLSPWRDTHLRLQGPAVKDLRAVFARDWKEAVDRDLDPGPDGTREEAMGEGTSLVVPMGPETEREFSTHLILEALRLAKERVWITTPYLVPSEAIGAALEQAVLRGIEVRILTTAVPDRYISFFANWFFSEKLRRAGVAIHRPAEGFMHQKVILVDDKLAGVGSMNLDNRSLRLNFEIMLMFCDGASIRQVRDMLDDDFAASRATEGEWDELGRRDRLYACVARLFAPFL